MSERQDEQPAVGEERTFADRIAEMSRQELERRALTQRDYIERYQKCIDGFGLWGPDGHRLPGDITKAVREAVGGAAAANSEKASDAEGARSCPAHGSPSALVVLLAAIERAQTESLRASSAEIYKAHRNHNRYLLRLSRRLGEMADEVARIIAPEANAKLCERGEGT